MALTDYGKPENDLGEWVDFGKDAPFRLRLRRIPGEKIEEIERRHSKTKNFEVRDGVRRPVLDTESILASLTDKAIWSWTDAEGLEITAGDEESAKLWSKMLSREIEQGATFSLSGPSLTAEAKRRVLFNHRPFARVDRQNDSGGMTEVEEDIGRFIVTEAARLQKSFGQKREEQAGNSSAG